MLHKESALAHDTIYMHAAHESWYSDILDLHSE